MDLLNTLQQLYPTVKEKHLYGRYITMDDVAGSLFCNHRLFSKRTIGFSVQKRPVVLFTAGSGSIKILMWSQMHGNESTTTKAMADLFNFLASGHDLAGTILSHCTLYAIPILNPDGALSYTRENANGADLNRDAQTLLQPESMALRELCDTINPHFCFNLHDQRSIYGVGDSPKSAVASFLSPLQDKAATLSPARKTAMQLIVAMNDLLQKVIPGHIGRYDDSFNPDCVGDTFQSLHIPTILFEAGHFKGDYQRETTRKFLFYALVQCIYILSEGLIDSYPHTTYFNIPENKKTFFDILINNIPYMNKKEKKNELIAIGIQYKEVLKKQKITFLPIIEQKGNLDNYYGHKMLNFKDKNEFNSLLNDKNVYKIVADFINSCH